MKKNLLILFIFLILSVSCAKSSEWEDIDWLFDMRFLTVNEFKSQINLRLIDNWRAGDSEGWTYTLSNNDFDYEYRFSFIQNRLTNVETIIKPVNMTPQELNQKLRQHITNKFKLSSFTDSLPEHGLVIRIENLLINGVRFAINYRNRPFPQNMFGEWKFRIDENTKTYINSKITSGYDRPIDISEVIWEISETHIADNEYDVDINRRIIHIFNEEMYWKYEFENNRILKIYLKYNDLLNLFARWTFYEENIINEDYMLLFIGERVN